MTGVERLPFEVSGFDADARLDTLPGNAVLIDSEGRICAVNTSWRRFADENGYLGETYGIGESYLAACSEDVKDGPAHAALAAGELRRVLRGDRVGCCFDYPCHSPTRDRWFRMVAVPVRIEKGHGVLAIHVDVTHERERLATLRAGSTPPAVTTDADIAAAGLVHDLKTPLNALLGFADVLQMGVAGSLTRKQREYVDLIHTAGRQLLEQVNAYLGDTGDSPDRIGDRLAEPAGVAADCLRLIAPLADARQVRLRTEVLPTLPRIAMDETVLRRILHNLLDNAVKYAGSGAAVTVRGAIEDGQLKLLVRDNGAGVDLFDLRHLTEPFVRGQDRGEDGHGLGLALVSSLAESVGAAFAIRSAPGHGFAGVLSVPPDRLRPADPAVLDRCAACPSDTDEECRQDLCADGAFAPKRFGACAPLPPSDRHAGRRTA